MARLLMARYGAVITFYTDVFAVDLEDAKGQLSELTDRLEATESILEVIDPSWMIFDESGDYE